MAELAAILITTKMNAI